MRVFIGLITYYTNFLPNMASFLSLLYTLLEGKQPWNWKLPQTIFFQKAKDILTHLYQCALTRIKKLFSLLIQVLGLVVFCRRRIRIGVDQKIVFVSLSFTKAEKNQSYRKVNLGLSFWSDPFHGLGSKFTLVTDYQPVVKFSFADKPVSSVASVGLHRWVLTLSAYAMPTILCIIKQDYMEVLMPAVDCQ